MDEPLWLEIPPSTAPRPSEDRRSIHGFVLLLCASVVAAGLGGCVGGGHQSTSPMVRQALAAERTSPPLGAYRGPTSGPRAQSPALIVFVAADLTDDDIATVARGVQQAAAAIGWPLRIVDGQGTVEGQTQALQAAVSARPGGIILAGFDAAGQAAALQQAKAEGVPVVGWHAAAAPGPDPGDGLFTNVAAEPGQLARVAADYVIAESKGSAGVVIMTDPESVFDATIGSLVGSDVGSCPSCSLLQVSDQTLQVATVNSVATTTILSHEYGSRFTYLLATNGDFIDAARTAMVDEGRSPQQPPFLISVGGGDATEFSRIGANDYQKAAIAEPLNLEGWQLIDELNRARAGQPPSGYVAPPYLITSADVPTGASFDPPSGYRNNYLQIWGR